MSTLLPSAQARQRLGRRLRALRVTAGLTGDQLAELIGTSQSRVSRTELAKFRAGLDMVRRWLDATGADKRARQELLRLAEQSLVEVESYRSIFRGSVATGQRIALEQEQASARIRHFQPFMIPGLLQTRAYATALLRAGRAPGEGGLEEAVALRLERGQRMRGPGAPDYHVVLMEQALRWTPHGVDRNDQKASWREIVAATKAPNITIQVIPLGTPTARAPLCGFVLTEFRDDLNEPPIAQVELPPVDMTFAGEKDVAAFEAAWQHMIDAALTPQRSAAFIRQLLRA